MADLHTGNAWSGPNPTLVSDPGNVAELASMLQATRDLTITGARIFGNPNSPARPGRRARFWNPVDRSLITSVALPDVMPAGWYVAPVALPLLAGESVVVSYDANDGFASRGGAFTAPALSTDQALRFPKGPGNGRFRLWSGAAAAPYPDAWSTDSPFYGVDVTYQWEGEDPPPTPPPPGSNPPSSTLVAAAWLRTLGLAAGVGTGRPVRVEDWAATGFVVVSTVGSGGTRDLPEQRRPILSLDSWGATLNSGKPPKNQTAGALELIRRAVESFALSVTVNPGAGYSQAMITDAWLESAESREAPDPDSSFAHYVMEVGLAWVPLG